ncbi:MAG: hypothetical protein ACOCYU_04880 [Brevefilum sp.]
MSQTSTSKSQRQPWYAWVLLFLLLALTAWGTRYWMSPTFGLYEDDLTFIPGAIEADFGDVLSMVAGYFSTLAEQGRPFMWSWVVLFGHLGWHLGGLQGMYIIGYSIWLINIILFVLLLKRIQGSFLFCVFGGLAYVLFPADTNQAFLFNAFGLQTAIIFFIVALHIYLSKGKLRWLAYFFLILVMLNYETPFWLFLAAPLLTRANGRDLKKRLLANTLLVTFIFLTIYLFRLAAGESRAASLGFPEMILIPIKHMAIGPFVGLGAYFLRPFQVLRNIDFGMASALLLASGIFFGFLYWVARGSEGSEKELLPVTKGWWADLTDETRRELRIFLAGLVMLILAYPLTVILRPYAISGRETRVHLASVVGASLIFASTGMVIFRALMKKGFRAAFLILLSLIFGFNFAFGFLIQRDYKKAWTLQKNFWQNVIPLIEDVREGTIVLVEPSGLEDTLYINANTWNVPRILPQMFVFPNTWEEIPRVFRMIAGWENTLVRIPGFYTLDGTNVFAFNRNFGDFRQTNTIFISTSSGEFRRRLDPLPLDGEAEVKPVGEEILDTFPTRPLYHLLIEDNE